MPAARLRPFCEILQNRTSRNLRQAKRGRPHKHAGDLYHLPQLMAVLAEIEDSNGNLTQAEAEYSRATDLVERPSQGLFPIRGTRTYW